MKRVISYFAKPECKVQFRNIVINPKDYTFSLELGTKEGRQKKFRYQTISGKCHNQLMEWLTRKVDEKVPVQNGDNIDYVKTGNKLTPFNIYLNKRGIEFKSGILQTLTFEVDNKSDSYADCPFKIVVHDNGATLTLVNIPAKKRVTYEDPTTGKTDTRYVVPTYIDKDGNRRKSWVSKDFYIRYIYKTTKEVEVATPEQIEAANQ